MNDDVQKWHQLDEKTLCERLQSQRTGLTQHQAEQRLLADGPNHIESQDKLTPIQMLLEQFKDFMIVILLVAAVVSGLVGELSDTIAIIVIVILNAIIGFVQAYRAEKAMDALQKMAMPTTRVLRDGHYQAIPSESLVAGDIVLLEAGNLVPADLRLLELNELWVDEAALTGESVPVSKQVKLLSGEVALAERSNMAFKGTLVSKGRALAMVVATGMRSELGHIAGLLQGQEQLKTPMQQRLEGFGRHLALAILGICALMFFAGLLRGEPVILMFLTAVSLAVAAIPEALPAVVTITLALGAKRMITHHALVRHLPAAETLGSVTYICSDKTGTLTQNRMRVEKYHFQGTLLTELADKDAQLFLLGMALNNDVEENEKGELTGEPTELALYQAARQQLGNVVDMQQQYPRVDELAFDSERKRMTTLHQWGESFIAFTKGAPEAIIPCTTLSDSERQQQLAEAEKLAAQGYRVLAFSQRHWPQMPDEHTIEHIESGLEFIGFVAMMDPPREEVFAAVDLCKSAGITPVMITGDHPATAQAIAQRLGIVDGEHKVLSGAELLQMSGDEFAQAVTHVRVYARVTPEQKIDIVQALQAQGEFVAMTGDGVNDAPALKRADIGVAMGKNGTDVAREAADMILLDDNFATIVAAVKEGRRIYDNIRKFIRYTMTSNSGEIWTLALAPFLGLPIPLLPIQILWINLVTDGLPGLALSAEKAEKGVMQRAPRPPNENVFAHGMWQQIIWIGLLIAGLSIGAQAWAYYTGSPNWQTMVFTVLTLSQLMNAMAIRSETQSLFVLGLFSNRFLNGAIALTLIMQLVVIYWPPAQAIFKTSALTATELVICLLLPFVVLFAVEAEKWFRRRGHPAGI